MKTYLKVVIGAIIIGGVFAYFFYKDISKEVIALTNKNYEVSLFQVGVFKNQDNALNYQNNFDCSIIYEDGDYYRVLVGIAYHEENKVKLESFLTNKGVDYYIKKVKMNEKFIKSLENYETVMLKTDKEEVINNINKAMLELFLAYYT